MRISRVGKYLMGCSVFLAAITGSQVSWAEQFSVFEVQGEALDKDMGPYSSSNENVDFVAVYQGRGKHQQLEFYSQDSMGLLIKSSFIGSELPVAENAGFYNVESRFIALKSNKRESVLVQQPPGQQKTVVRTIVKDLSKKEQWGFSSRVDQFGDVLYSMGKRSRGVVANQQVFWSDTNGNQLLGSFKSAKVCYENTLHPGKKICQQELAALYLDEDGNALVLPPKDLAHSLYRPAGSTFRNLDLSQVGLDSNTVSAFRGNFIMFVSNNGQGEVVVVALDSLKVVNSIPTGLPLGSAGEWELNPQKIDQLGNIVGYADLYVPSLKKVTMSTFFVKKVNSEIKIPNCMLSNDQNNPHEEMYFLGLSKSGILRTVVNKNDEKKYYIRSLQINSSSTPAPGSSYQCDFAVTK